MRTLIFIALCLLISGAASCSTAKKVECVAAFTGCGTICLCDFPACECCVACLACVTATAANCCECLFPSWSACTNNEIMQVVHKRSVEYQNQTAGEQTCMYEGKSYSCGASVGIYGVGYRTCCCAGTTPYWSARC